MTVQCDTQRVTFHLVCHRVALNTLLWWHTSEPIDPTLLTLLIVILLVVHVLSCEWRHIKAERNYCLHIIIHSLKLVLRPWCGRRLAHRLSHSMFVSFGYHSKEAIESLQTRPLCSLRGHIQLANLCAMDSIGVRTHQRRHYCRIYVFILKTTTTNKRVVTIGVVLRQSHTRQPVWPLFGRDFVPNSAVDKLLHILAICCNECHNTRYARSKPTASTFHKGILSVFGHKKKSQSQIINVASFQTECGTRQHIK